MPSKLLAYLFGIYPHSIIPNSESIQNDKKEVNQKVLGAQLAKLENLSQLTNTVSKQHRFFLIAL